jgi:hypothetical protein
MNASKYELTYAIATSAINATSEIEKIVEILRKQDKPLTCKQLGELVYGDAYKRTKQTSDWDDYRLNAHARELTGRLNQALKHLASYGYIEVETIKSELRTWEEEELVWIDESNEPQRLEVWDAPGNKYLMDNPKYDRRNGHREWRKVIKSAYSKVNTYKWIGD